MLYAKSHMQHDYCLKKAKELRQTGEYSKVRIGNTIQEDGQKYSKIYVYKEEQK